MFTDFSPAGIGTQPLAEPGPFAGRIVHGVVGKLRVTFPKNIPNHDEGLG